MPVDGLYEAADRMKTWFSWNVGDQPVHPYWDDPTLKHDDTTALVRHAIEVIYRERRTGGERC